VTDDWVKPQTHRINDAEHALSFGRAAAHYDSIRPTYPADAARWALGPAVSPGHGTVIELGAGTGLLTRVLVGLAGRVVPVEPDPDMRAQLEASVPGTTAVDGAAESIPSPDAGGDAVICGQAYHWFDRDRAHPEIARVLRPGGCFAAVWNTRDDEVPWLQDLAGALGDPPTAQWREREGHRSRSLDFGPLFEAVERAVFRHEVSMNADQLVALAASRSSYLVADEAKRSTIEADVRAIAASLPPTFPMPYVTICYRAARR
jgi:SAM-dependent methyltransferase